MLLNGKMAFIKASSASNLYQNHLSYQPILSNPGLPFRVTKQKYWKTKQRNQNGMSQNRNLSNPSFGGIGFSMLIYSFYQTVEYKSNQKIVYKVNNNNK